MPELNSRKIQRRLKQEGWMEVSQAGSHKKFRHPKSGKTLIVPDWKKDLKTGTARSIARLAGWE